MNTHATTSDAFDTVLIANRGEIAVRVIRTVHRMGLRAVAIYSDADAHAPHVLAADTAVNVGPAAAAESYLNIDKVIAAARASGAQAIHPGYGFLSENAAFARRCEEEGIVFIGPPATAIDKMGDKITARTTVESRDVPTVPGISRPGLTDEEIIAAAPEIGFPVLIKPSAGGGGKGMHRVDNPDDLPKALVSARREAASSFGDDSLFLEHFVDTPRHIEVQIVADEHGNVVHLGERECSLQRRHQKVIEEAPSALLDEATREEIGQSSCDAARACGYRGAGTVEFIVSAKQPERFFFMEMNTRLQVEHPVTELVTGVDLVEWQIRVARGEELPLAQEQITLTGHAVEARVYAEDPAGGFLPTGGTITELQWPQTPGVRVDSGVREGQVIGGDYDPMLAKIITHGSNRDQALSRLDQALGHTVVGGLVTNINFNRFLVTYPDVVRGDMHTGLLDEIVGDYRDPATPAMAYMVAALAAARQTRRGHDTLGSAWTSGDSWRAGGTSAPIRLLLGDGTAQGIKEVELQRGVDGSSWSATVAPVQEGSAQEGEDEAAAPEHVSFAVVNSGDDCVQLAEHAEGAEQGTDGAHGEIVPTQHWTIATSHGQHLVLSGPSGSYELQQLSRSAALAEAAAGDADIASPMPGTVISIEVADGEEVAEGQAVLVIEAMKMEHTLTAAHSGQVTVHVGVGDKVTTGEVLAGVEKHEE